MQAIGKYLCGNLKSLGIYLVVQGGTQTQDQWKAALCSLQDEAQLHRSWQSEDLCPAQSSQHMLAPALLPRPAHTVAFPLLPAGTWACQTKQIKSAIDLPQLLVPQVTVKAEWVEYKVCLASLL